MKKLLLIVLILFACDSLSPEETDCAGVEGGTAVTDDCGLCTGGITGLEANYTKDECGVCFGNSSTCIDCSGIPNGDDYFDCAGECGLNVEVWDDCYNIEETTIIGGYYNPSTNGLTIPPEIGNFVNLTEFSPQGGGLIGEIPFEIGNLTNLEILYLNVNQLSGNIPSAIGHLYNLEQLLLYENQLSGDIPSSVGNLTNIEWFLVRDNQLTSIPESFCNIITNHNFYYSFENNSICGELPSCLTADDIGEQNCL